MKSAQYEANGEDLKAITVVDVPKPSAGEGEVVVKIAYAAVNPVDWKVFQGHLNSAWKVEMPFHPGYDFSGAVVEVGAGVTEFETDDEVFAVNWGQNTHDDDKHIAGTFAEYIAIAASKVTKKPAELSHAKAAAIALVGTTAHQSLFSQLKVTAGQKVLILGGAGSVGIAGIQLAKGKSVWVATTCSPRTEEFVKSLNPDKTVNYRENDWSEDPELKGVDAVFDAIGEKDGFARAKKILKPDGRFVSIASFDAGFDPTAHAPLAHAAFFCLANDPAVQAELAALAAGDFKMPIEAEFSFTTQGVQDALAKQLEGKAIGKYVIKM